MTKTELLDIMERHNACWNATKYVHNQATEDAGEILGACARIDWLIWLLGRERRLDRFVCICAKRAKKHAAHPTAHPTAHHAAHHAAHAAHPTAHHAAHYAADYATAAAAVAAAERGAQLKGLQRIGREWAAGLPAEVAVPF